MKKVSLARQIRVRQSSRKRAKEIRNLPCVICGNPGNRAHHIIPIRFGGSYGKYNLLPCCEDKDGCKAHSRLNKLSNHWCKLYMPKMEGSLREKTEACKAYILQKIESAKKQRERRANLRKEAKQEA